MKHNKPAAALPPSSPRAKRGPRAAAFFPILLLAASILSCLKPIGFGPEDLDPPPSDSTLADPAPITITDIAPVTGHDPEKEIPATSEYMGTITWSPAITNVAPYADKFKAFQDYTATIDLAMKGGRLPPPAGTKVTVDGALSAEYDAAGIITAKFPRTHYPVNDEAELTAAIAALPSTPAGAGSETLIELTQAFYGSVNDPNPSSYISIGLDATENTIPYTVRGLGKFSTEKLKVGILLANNDITLEDVRIEITDSTKGVPRKWSGSSAYRAAILIGRYTDSFTGPATSFEAGDSGSKNVTVKNCNISFKDNTSMIAGILISDGKTLNEHITIDHNEIAVEITKNGTPAAQALLLYRYDPGISITNNGLSSKNRPITDLATVNPAGGILMHISPTMDSSVTPLISGNVINGYPTYDFYINIFSPGDRTGVPALLADNFATPDSKWMTAASTDKGSFYKKLLTTLLDQSRQGAGYGFLGLWLKYSDAPLVNDYVFECYSQTTNRLSAIDFWGYEIEEGPMYKKTPEFRARLLLGEDGYVYDTDTFHWTNDIEGTNIPPPSSP